jgi:Zn-dependent peptidase ImmA (M78 family)/DNA-binding Xre family transcriptional regulator
MVPFHSLRRKPMPVDPRMVTMTREARGWNQADLSGALEITQGHLSKLEAGLVEVTPDLLRRLARVLECPIELLEYTVPSTGIEVTCLHHRRRASTMGAPTKRRIEALARLTRISIEGLLAGVDLERPHTLVRLEGMKPENAAEMTRRSLGIGDGPIPNVVRAVESAGVVILHRALGTASQDAVSTWPRADAASPMMLVNTGLPGDRLRFTISHELGHLVLHSVPGDEQEVDADRFASAFLAPAEQIRPDLHGLGPRDMGTLMQLKSKWGMSIAALVRRAHDLDEISLSEYKEFQVRLSRLGWRHVEPGEVAKETPTLVPRLVALRTSQQGATTAELARLALISEDVFRRYFLGESPAETTMKLVIEGA